MEKRNRQARLWVRVRRGLLAFAITHLLRVLAITGEPPPQLRCPEPEPAHELTEKRQGDRPGCVNTQPGHHPAENPCEPAKALPPREAGQV